MSILRHLLYLRIYEKLEFKQRVNTTSYEKAETPSGVSGLIGEKTVSSLSHLSLNLEGRWGTTDDFATSFLYFPLFSTALWDLPNSRPVHFLMLSSHLFPYLPCLLPLFTMVMSMTIPMKLTL